MTRVMNDRRVMIKTIESEQKDKGNGAAVAVESVADILERELNPLISDWLLRVEQEPDLRHIPLTFEERTGHLPRLRFRRLRAIMEI